MQKRVARWVDAKQDQEIMQLQVDEILWLLQSEAGLINSQTDAAARWSVVWLASEVL